MRSEQLKTISLWICLLLVGVGIGLRFVHITQNSFVYYDEGLYLDSNRQFLRIVEQQLPFDSPDIFNFFKTSMLLALNTGKVLWFFLSDLRIFFGGVEQWYFGRILSALFGTATIGIVYLFAKRFTDSHRIGVLSAVFLALMPSHILHS